MKTIGLVLSQPPAYSETFFNAKIKGLQEIGFQVVLLVQSNPDNYELCKVKVGYNWSSYPVKRLAACIKVAIRILLNPSRIRRFVKLERQAKRSWTQIFKNTFTNSHMFSEHLDWLHFGFATLALQSEHVAKAIGSKMAVSLRGFDIDVYPLKHPDCYKLLWSQVDKVHAISNYLLQSAYQLGLSKETDVQIITPAIDIEKFKMKPEKIASIETKLLTVARLHWMKGLTETLEALAILKQEGVRFNYTIIGAGDLYESLCFTIHQLDLTDSVFLAGKKSQGEVIQELTNTDIYIQYSQSEGFCNAVLEAQAVGAICIVSDGGGLPENIIHQETGWIVPKRQPKALADILLYVLQIPSQEKLKIMDLARGRVAKDFSIEYQKNQFVEFYKA
ncbi:glycosyltransferase [Flavobacteriaceae bacterium LYZ1037]|nr:glycosyltransferase [Flavobacteriaceae bacterium LYZ1037]